MNLKSENTGRVRHEVENMQGYETGGRLIFFGVWDFEYKIDIFPNRTTQI